MTRDSVSVEDIDVVRAPGLDSSGLPVDKFSSGINIVHGPNASGKSTLAKAVQWLLWPEEAPSTSTLSGNLSLNGQAWRVDVDRGRGQYQRNGEDANGPNLPPADHRDRYHLALHDLLQEDTRNETFAQQIKRESAGGFDLNEAHDALGFDDSPSTRGKSEVKNASQAIEAWRDAKGKAQELKDEERRLSRLHQDLEAAKDAQERVELLDQAIEYAEARDELDSAESRVDQFSDEVALLDGDEVTEVEDLEEKIAEWEEKKEDARDTIDEAEEELEDADLPDEGVPDATITRLKECRDELDNLEGEEKRLERKLEDARAQRKSARGEIPLDVDHSDLEELDPDAWEEVDEFVREAVKVREEREIQSQVERWLGGDDRPSADRSTLESGRNALENWLANPQANANSTGDTASTLAITSAVLLAGAGALLGILVDPVLFAIDAVAVGIAVYGFKLRRGRTTGSDRSAHRETFEGLDLDAPASWSESDVRKRLGEIYDDIAKHQLAEQREQKWDTLAKDVGELTEKEESLSERRAELQAELGAAPAVDDLQILAIVKGVQRWQDAHSAVVGSEAELESVTEQIEEAREQLREELAPFGYDEVSDAAQASGHIQDLETRKSNHESAKQRLTQARERVEEAEEEIRTLESERDSIYEEIGLLPTEKDRLRELCEQVDEYEDAVNERDNAQHLADKERNDLEAFPGYEPELLSKPVPELQSEKRELQETADEYEEIQNEITSIETRIHDAKQSTEIEDALAEKERKLDALAEQLEDDYAAMVGDVLVDHVREATLESSRPAVFQRASDILARITKGRYELLLDEDGDTFRAYDTVSERGYALDQLSSGTRLQVLLSVRIAFVEQQEQGVQLPLLLDETLANSDDGKAEIIIESMIELARHGRQVFYFTAQGDEVARWLAALNEEEAVDHAVIDLGDVREFDGEVAVPPLDDLADVSTSPPEPEGHDHESYGEALDVPQFDPRRGPGHAHIWYVVDDVDLVYRLLDLGFERWGQVENLLSHTDGEMISDDPDELRRIQRNGEALEVFVKAWQRGRGKPVDRQVLRETSAVSEHFIDEVAELVEKHNGDGEAIIRSLRDREVDNFRTDKMDELERFFEEHGYIEPVDPLSPEDIRARVMSVLLSNDVSREEAHEQAETLIARFAGEPLSPEAA